jgi:Protein of unknown function (DUF2384)
MLGQAHASAAAQRPAGTHARSAAGLSLVGCKPILRPSMDYTVRHVCTGRARALAGVHGAVVGAGRGRGAAHLLEAGRSLAAVACRTDDAARRRPQYQWKAGKVGPLDRHVLERLSYLFGIYAALQLLFPERDRADAWVRKPNSAPLFGGRSALQRMLGGQVADLYVVRQYLDAQRGGKA